ncbi:DUF3140 domain-containing protein [Thalassorhabdomicrobium marinisediminis]|uniref:DNA-binding protein n=1 Tax=Thalassorhabdomicrobium marinisediminis TaxID=2170577 RepID=A0A2T7G072_9RHOB|nr:DUF3140 domain-containing protein [Thalassorhabdomicrobium marinisediminis]PVA07823.1 DNA-binding protein [Thalassorhabdomicrobium marinisediminis]
MSDKSREEIWCEWRDLVNMAPKEIEDWLATDESKSVGDTGDADSTGRKSGKRIIEIKRTNKDDLTDDDWDHMATVVGYIKRHGAQVPDAPEGSDWAYSMKNWGHDPFKEGGKA